MSSEHKRLADNRYKCWTAELHGEAKEPMLRWNISLNMRRGRTNTCTIRLVGNSISKKNVIVKLL